MSVRERVHITHEFKADPRPCSRSSTRTRNTARSLAPRSPASATAPPRASVPGRFAGSRSAPYRRSRRPHDSGAEHAHRVQDHRGEPAAQSLGPPGADTDRGRRDDAQLHDRVQLGDPRDRRPDKQGAHVLDHQSLPLLGSRLCYEEDARPPSGECHNLWVEGKEVASIALP